MNRIKDFLLERDVASAYQFQKQTGLAEATAYRLFNKREVYPDRRTVNTICKTFDAQPGDFLVYVPDDESALYS